MGKKTRSGNQIILRRIHLNFASPTIELPCLHQPSLKNRKSRSRNPLLGSQCRPQNNLRAQAPALVSISILSGLSLACSQAKVRRKNSLMAAQSSTRTNRHTSKALALETCKHLDRQTPNPKIDA